MKRMLWLLAFLLAAPASEAGERTVVLSVPGMNCALCPITVRKSLERVAGVKSVEVSLARKQAVVIYDDGLAGERDLLGATEHAGYPAAVLSLE